LCVVISERFGKCNWYLKALYKCPDLLTLLHLHRQTAAEQWAILSMAGVTWVLFMVTSSQYRRVTFEGPLQLFGTGPVPAFKVYSLLFIRSYILVKTMKSSIFHVIQRNAFKSATNC